MQEENKNTPNQNVTIKTANFFDAVGSKWGMISGIFLAMVSIIGLFYRQTTTAAQVEENKADIKSIEMRMSAVEGDIKAIRQGVDYLIADKKNGN